MLFDRISLVKAYTALRIVENNDGPVSNILFNKTAHYGTKTVIRFKSTSELKSYINTHFPRQLFDPKCQCGTGIEQIYTLLNFNAKLETKNVSFVNNLRGEFESAENAEINKLSKDALGIVFKTDARLKFLIGNYACLSYIQNQNLYVNPCEYVEVISNTFYDELIALYGVTTHIELDAAELFQDPFETLPPVPPTTLAPTTIVPTTLATQGTYTAYTNPTSATTELFLATTTQATAFTAATNAFTTQATEATTFATQGTSEPMGPSNLVHATQNYIDSNGDFSSFWDYNAVDGDGNFVHDNTAIVNSYENPSLGNMNGGQDQHLKSATGPNGDFSIGDDIMRWYPGEGWTYMSDWGMGPQYRGVYEDTTGKYSNANENWIVRIDENGVLVEFIPFSQVTAATTSATLATTSPTTAQLNDGTSGVGSGSTTQATAATAATTSPTTAQLNDGTSGGGSGIDDLYVETTIATAATTEATEATTIATEGTTTTQVASGTGSGSTTQATTPTAAVSPTTYGTTEATEATTEATEATTLATEATTLATEATTIATAATTEATEATTLATEATTEATEATTLATEATTLATEATTLATEATTEATEATTLATEATTLATEATTAPTTSAPIPYYVSNDGNDDVSTTGAIDDPYASLDYAISQITNQDTIYFREGSYEFNEEEITNNGLSLQAYNNENVTFDGTRSIEELRDANWEGGWTPYTTNVVTDENQTINDKTLYRIKLRDDVEIWQLFHDRNEVINARWPSAQWEDETVYDRAKWGHGYHDINNSGDIKDSSGNVLGNGTSSPYYYENGEIVDVAYAGNNLYDFVTAQQAINSEFDLTGALANLNVGSFRTYTKKINSQTLDATNNLIRLSYDNVATWKEKHHYYYLENKLEFLNSENEWFFDNNSKMLYVWLENDEVPSTTNMRAKVQSYSLNVTGDDVTVEDINFFSTTLRGNSAHNLTVRDCDFMYSSCYAHMLDQINYGTPIAPTTNEVFETQTRVTSSSNVTFDRCAFRYTDGDVIHTSGGDTTIENSYFNYIDKTAANLSSVMTSLRMMGSNNTVKNNTFRKTGASSTLNSGNAPIIEYNDMAASGYLQSDGAMIHLMTAQQENAKVRYNWVHDTIKYGIRFDGDGEGFNGYIHHNIGWNCEGAIMAKGGMIDPNTGNSVGGHFIYNNTAFNSNVKNDIMVLNVQAGQNINYDSVVMNNLAETLSGHRSNAEAFEPRIINSNNFTPTEVEPYLVDANNGDYRPKNVNQIVDAGNTTYTNSEFNPTGVDALTDDIGALQYGETAWQAGINWDNSDRFNFYFEPIPATTTLATTLATEATTLATEATTLATEATTLATEATTVATAAPWTPSSLGPVAWIDAADASSYTVESNTLTSVTDKAGTYTMSINNTPTVSTGPGGLPTFYFGTNEYLQSTSYEPQVSNGNHWSIGLFRYDNVDHVRDSFWSYETNANQKRDYAVSSGASNNTWPGELDLDGLSSNRISSTIGNKLDFNVGGLNRYQWYIIVVYFNKTGNQIGFRIDGRTNSASPVNDYDNSLSTNQELRIMRNRSSQSLNGRMGEFMTFADLPGTGGTDMSEIEKAEGYLAHKWGLTGQLENAHPYKNTPPTV